MKNSPILKHTHYLIPLILYALLFIFSASPLLADTPTIEQISEQLEEAALLAEAGEIEAAKALLAELEQVELTDNAEQTLSLASEGWQTLLETHPDDAPRLLRQAATELRTSTTLSPDTREQLEQVLARPEFQPAQPTWRQRLLNWLLSWLPDISPSRETAFFGDLLRWTIGGISALVVLGVLISFWRGIRQNILSTEQELDGFDGPLPLHANEAQQQATAAATAGNYREAMRLLYLAALLHLDEVGLIRFDRALTNREVLQTVSENQPLRQLLARVVNRFDQVWYGHAPFEASDFEKVRGEIEELRTMRAVG